jgi:hypothetical protein
VPDTTRSFSEWLALADETLAEAESPARHLPKEGSDRRNPCGCQHRYRTDPPGWETIVVCAEHDRDAR